MMRALALSLLVSILSVTGAAQNVSGHGSEINWEQTKWVNDVLLSINTVKAGMTRSDLLTVFTTEGGLSTTSRRTYVYRQCPYIKVDVKFAAANAVQELPTDKILEISRPYLDWSVMD